MEAYIFICGLAFGFVLWILVAVCGSRALRKRLETDEWYAEPYWCSCCGCYVMVRVPSENPIYPYDDVAPECCPLCGKRLEEVE